MSSRRQQNEIDELRGTVALLKEEFAQFKAELDELDKRLAAKAAPRTRKT